MLNFFKKKTPELLKNAVITEANYIKETEIMTVKYNNGGLLSVKQYKGSGTVWHTYPMMKRCDTYKEGVLYDVYQYIKNHGNPYPTSHEKNSIEMSKQVLLEMQAANKEQDDLFDELYMKIYKQISNGGHSKWMLIDILKQQYHIKKKKIESLNNPYKK